MCVCLYFCKKRKRGQKLQKLRYISELSWNFLKNTNAHVWLFSPNSRCVSDEQPCLKTTGLYEDLFILPRLFHFFSFILHPFHLAVFQFLCLFFFFKIFFLKPLSSVVEKPLYIYIHSMYNIYFRKLMNFCLAKKFMTFSFHLFDLVWREC